MCRIFYSLNQSNLEKTIDVFLSQSIGSDAKRFKSALDGYGLASLSASNKWAVYKTPASPLDDPKIKDKMARLSNASKLVVGHIRNAMNHHSPKPAIENTHPFYNKNRIMVHNGYFDGAHLNKTRKWFYANILPEFHSHIKGKTDTELFFYLFLSIFERRKWIYGDIDMLKGKGCSNPTKFDELKDAVSECFRIIDGKFDHYVANFIYADKEYSVVARFSKNATEEDNWTHPLYNQEGGTKMLFSTEPILSSHKLMKWGTFYVINHLTGEHYRYKL